MPDTKLIETIAKAFHELQKHSPVQMNPHKVAEVCLAAIRAEQVFTQPEFKDMTAGAAQIIYERIALGWIEDHEPSETAQGVFDALDAAGFCIVPKADYEKLNNAFIVQQVRAGNFTVEPILKALQ